MSNRKEKILFVAPRYHSNLHDQVEMFRENGHRVKMFTLYSLISEDKEDFQPEELGYSKIFRVFRRLFRGKARKVGDDFTRRYGMPPVFSFFKKAQEFSPDVVVMRDITNAFSLVALVFAKISGAKPVALLQVNDRTLSKKSKSITLVGKLFGAEVITPLYLSSRVLEKHSHLHVIPFIQKPKKQNKNIGTESKMRILSIGKYIPSKGQKILLETLEKLGGAGAFVQVTFVGVSADHEYFQELQNFVQEKNLEKQVTFKKDLSWLETQEEYQKADLFVLPTISEPASVSVLEAMSCGLPVISSDGNGTHCYIEEGKNGFVFRAGDALDLSEKLSCFLEEKTLLAKMGDNAYHTVLQNHSPEVCYEDFKTIFEAKA